MADRADPLSRIDPGRQPTASRLAARRRDPRRRPGDRWLELAWLGWFLVVPLPNVADRRKVIVRGGCSCCSRRSPRSCPDTVPAVAARQGPARAEPRREPAPAAADRPGRRPDRGRGDRPRRPGLGGLLGLRDRLRWPVADRAGLTASGRQSLGVLTLARRPDGLARSLAGPASAWACSAGVGSSASGAWRFGRARQDLTRQPSPAAKATLRRAAPIRAAWFFGLLIAPFVVDHDPGLDAAGDRLRRHRVSPARAQGVLPGRADRIPAAQRLHEHAVRRGDAPPAGHGSDGATGGGGRWSASSSWPCSARPRPC